MSNGEKMNFPNSIWEFLFDYSFIDEEQVYTNGISLIPTFRVKQAIEHYYEDKESEEMTAEEINNLKYKVCCPLCDHDKCVRGTDKCEAEMWAKQKRSDNNED